MQLRNDLFGASAIVDSTIDVALRNIRTPIITQRAINTVLALCAFGIVTLLALAFQMGASGYSFFTWSVLSALGSTLAGGAVGLLFALPARRQDPRGTNLDGAVGTSGYEESTSLEQIADWLTKIIVGLTLTQFTTWAAAFDRLSLRLTHDLLCPGSATMCGYAPGAALVSAYSLAGFVIAYLWTRRFFILEMVNRDDAVRGILGAQAQRDQAAKEGRVQQGTAAPDAEPVDYSDAVNAILNDGKRNATNDAMRTAAARIKPGSDTDDPWRGAFGGASSDDRALLTASVSPLPGESRNFQVDLIVAGVAPESQRQLAGQKVLLYLHPTFGKEVKVISFGADGRAALQLFAYGAFTVGALLEDGRTLELNLATLPGAPDQFKFS